MFARRWAIFRDYLFPALLMIILFAVMVCYHPGEIPPLWFDEGWSLSVAKNWVETGQYARLLENIPVSAKGMAKPLSITGPIALSFYLFGVGIWQARLPAVFSMVSALYLTFQLVKQVFGHKVAYLTLFVLLFMVVPPVHPLIIGRQAIAEAPMILYLTAGYFVFLAVLKGRKYALFGAMLFWGLALDAKGHTLPFWSLSMLLPVIYSILRKEWQRVGLIGTAWIGSLFVYFIINSVENALIGDLPAYDGPMKGLYSVTVFVLDPGIRLATFKNFFIQGLPTLFGLGFAIIHCRRIFCSKKSANASDYIVLTLVGLTFSWFLWFFLFSIGWVRYFFPVSYFGSIFIAQLLSILLERWKQLVKGSYKDRPLVRLPLYLLLLLLVCVLVINGGLLRYQITQGNDGAIQVSEFIRENIRPDALIETYESELLFLVENPVHFPPDQVQIELNKRHFFQRNVPIPYSPLSVDFDYLVDGPSSTLWKLYTPMLSRVPMAVVFEADGYTIYK